MDRLTPVEQVAVTASAFDALYEPAEKIPTVMVDNFPALGRLAAMRFVEWVQDHPEGVISLPTGKTPEHFIKWVQHLLQTWGQTETQSELAAAGIDPTREPRLDGLHFVQIDEFYPIEPVQSNSFYAYVNRFYLKGFGLDAERALLMNCHEMGLRPGQTLRSVWGESGEVDLSLRYRAASGHLEREQQQTLGRIDQWCQEYEERIRQLGGIGFFLGGIGPDGHIGFNVRGSDHRSTTRLTQVNYETQAAAAGDLGGMEISRRRLVVTIGLGTITAKPDACALIVAAGEAKAHIVAEAIQHSPDIEFPATALQQLPNARFYITTGAAKHLGERRRVAVEQVTQVDDELVERVLVDLSVKCRKRLTDLTAADAAADAEASAMLKKHTADLPQLATQVRDGLIAKIERGGQTLSNTKFLHTEPHHDDLMLGYLPYIVRHVRDANNTHTFACLTGGFTAVTNDFICGHLQRLQQFLPTADFERWLLDGYFEPEFLQGRNRDVW